MGHVPAHSNVPNQCTHRTKAFAVETGDTTAMRPLAKLLWTVACFWWNAADERHSKSACYCCEPEASIVPNCEQLVGAFIGAYSDSQLSRDQCYSD